MEDPGYQVSWLPELLVDLLLMAAGLAVLGLLMLSVLMGDY